MNINNDCTLPKITAKKPVYSITPFTMLDYPDKTACIIWFAGCNMRCPYCYNPDIVSGEGRISAEDALAFVNSRKTLLDGVVLSGGECTRYKDIVNFAAAIKRTGMLVKIDTNGSNPSILTELVTKGLADYIALDFKAPASLFREVTQSRLFRKFESALCFLISSGIPFEVRTTYHSDLLSPVNIDQMALFLRRMHYKGTYYIQNYVGNTATLGNTGKSSALRPGDLAPAELNIVIRN